MQKFIYSLLFIGFIFFSGCQSPEVANFEPFPPLIPKPQNLEIKKGVFKITENTTLFFEEEFTITGLRNI